jgi:uncharacterized protein Usg
LVDVLDWYAVWPPRGARAAAFFSAKALALIPARANNFQNAIESLTTGTSGTVLLPERLTQVGLSAAAVGSLAKLLESNLRIRNGGAMVSEDFRKQALGYGLTTAHILYRRPDHRWLLQSYIWQNYDLFPEFPELHRFLAFWQEKLEGPLHSVRVAHCKLIKPAEIKAIDGEFRLH